MFMAAVSVFVVTGMSEYFTVLIKLNFRQERYQKPFVGVRNVEFFFCYG